MSRRLQNAVDRWLRAERAAAGGSERALRRVFRALPQPPLPAGFAARVLAGAGLAPRPRVAVPLAGRLGVGGALLLAATAAATAPRILAGVAGQFTAGDLLRLAAGAVVETCQRLAEGLALWQTASSIGGTFAEALSAPPFLAAMLAAILLSAGGLRMLHGLLAVEGRRDDVRA